MFSVKPLDAAPLALRETARSQYWHSLLETLHDTSLLQHRWLDLLVGRVGAADCGQPQHNSSTELRCSHLFKVSVGFTARGGLAECFEYCT